MNDNEINVQVLHDLNNTKTARHGLNSDSFRVFKYICLTVALPSSRRAVPCLLGHHVGGDSLLAATELSLAQRPATNHVRAMPPHLSDRLQCLVGVSAQNCALLEKGTKLA